MSSASSKSDPGLNAAQRAAVEHDRGPLLVLAGAGSGKTRVITHRIARIVKNGVQPQHVLAVSFTNKAAGEMAERMVPLVGVDASRKLVLSTFHSFGVRFLSEEAKALGVGDAGRFVIFDQGDCLGLLRELARQERGGERKLDMAAVLARISRWKGDDITPEQTVGRAMRDTGEYDEAARELYPRYEKALRAMHAVDFDDLVVQPVRILRAREDLREKWRTRFKHLLVDEFQDTSRSQLELVRLLANESRNVCVVGDDDQSIYAWRGADVTNILEFEKHFPGAVIIKLEDNYRSVRSVLEVANAAIARSPGKRHQKTLRASRGDGDKVRISVVDDAELEAKLVATEIRELMDHGENGALPRKPRDFAVLYRSNLLARVIEEELRARQVPYRLFGGTQYFDRKEVKDCAAYLRAVVYPRDEISLRRILNYPVRGIGDTTVERLDRWARAKDVSLAEALLRIDTIPDVPDAAKRGANKLMSLISDARATFRADRGLASAARKLFSDAGILEALGDAGEGKDVAKRRMDNVEWLLGSIDRYEKQPGDEKASLASFLARITIRIDKEDEDAGNRVTLSTLHAAKGLEFPVVFLVGLVEGILPHSRTTDPKVSDVEGSDVEEERRLFYVGVTRARDRLYLTRPKRRLMRGRPTPLAPSRFLEGLPEQYVESYDRVLQKGMELSEMAELARQFLEKLG